ncbi:hypothetical protein PLICRDRAFT_110634 [Plicaturopsis crispa FD-325 SS-3]|nr:hypothetical protein PLICRDRAFT_110634 [Plicaturopsis crispa FD-325 SS-3]
MASSNDVQRLFLQAILSRRVVSAKLAKVLYAKCVEAVKAADENLAIQYTGSDAEWDNIITKVNNAIDGLDLEFKSQHDETTGRPMYALVNTKGDGIAQIATDYTANEITYFKAIVEQIMLGPRECYSVSSMAALREVNDIKNMTKSQGEVLLSSFVANGWLLKSKCVVIYMTTSFRVFGIDTPFYQTRPVFSIDSDPAGTTELSENDVPRRGCRMHYLLRGQSSSHPHSSLPLNSASAYSL